MEELIFFGIIIALSIIDSIARRVKAKRQAGRSGGDGRPSAGGRTARGEASRRYEPAGRVPAPAGRTGSRVETYDAEPTYDARATAERSGGEEVETYDSAPTYDEGLGSDETARSGRTSGGTGGAATSSAGMIPADLWEEIAGLARGRAQEAPARPTPPARPSAPARPSPPMRARKPPRTVEPHPIHRAHELFGTDPSERTELERVRPGGKRGGSAAVRAVRDQLAGNVDALRRAVIVQEVLGPPMALRPDRIEELLER